MISKSVEFNKNEIVISFEDGNSLTITKEIAEQIWYYIESREVQEIINLSENEFNKKEIEDITEYYIGRARSITKLLKDHILEEAYFDFERNKDGDEEIDDSLLNFSKNK